MKNKLAFKLFGSAALLTAFTLTSVGAAQANSNPSDESTLQAQEEITPDKRIRTGLTGSRGDN